MASNRLTCRRGIPGSGALLALSLVVAACGDDGVSPGTLRFGQSGDIQIQVITPLFGRAGQVSELIVWRSAGAWQLFESIAYRSVTPGFREPMITGDERRRAAQGTASAYAELIALVSETDALKLDGVDATLVPTCEGASSKVILRLYDQPRDETREWQRCGHGPLASLTPEGSGPDPGAGRVVNAMQLVREFTLGAAAPVLPTYHLSVPFGTLDRGSDSRSTQRTPKAWVGEIAPDSTRREPADWAPFWRAHTGRDVAPPPVDWAREMVLFVTMGQRFEAGDSIEVRRVLPVGDGTNVEFIRTAPGNFCSPASRTHVPFHLVVAPLTTLPIRFSDQGEERIACGF
ncbi:MAG: hypothetical protein HY701_07785 [Gemmatimonadetes bacterium]|nr:hypothetical protein [Gemmatimonadota bacterium]